MSAALVVITAVVAVETDDPVVEGVKVIQATKIALQEYSGTLRVQVSGGTVGVSCEDEGRALSSPAT